MFTLRTRRQTVGVPHGSGIWDLGYGIGLRSGTCEIPDLSRPLFVHCASSVQRIASIRIRAQCISMLGKHRWQCLRQKRLSFPNQFYPNQPLFLFLFAVGCLALRFCAH